jgi:DNA-binding LytR/AlgR family response regulator
MKVAVVDDTQADAQRLEEYLARFQQERNLSMQVHTFLTSFDFLDACQGDYDVIFLDIEMPGNDGLEVAKEIRKKDEVAGIIFVTNMAQYAIRGYEVNAIDFMVKPVNYFNFTQKLDKALRSVRRQDQRFLLLNNENGMNRVLISDILYVEKNKNYLVYHTRKGDFQARGTMQELKGRLTGGSTYFSECAAGCLVNLSYVMRVGREDISLSDVNLPLSRRMKKGFTQDYMDYVGGML